jgi:iron complex outermembrane receptor protein
MLLAAALPPNLAAQVAPRDSAHALGPEVVVSATRDEAREFDLPVAIDSVDGRVVREDNAQVNLSESLNRVPGIVVQNRQNYAQDLQLSSRGFGARSAFGVRGVRLVADGIPATMPDGQGQSATFSLSSASRIEVLRGPFAALYGNASGGFIQTFTEDGPERPTVRPSLSAGSYDSYRAGLVFGGTADALNYLVDASRFHTGGRRLPGP